MIHRVAAECARTCSCLFVLIRRLASVAGCQALPVAQEAGRAFVNLYAISFLLCAICQTMSRTLGHPFFFSAWSIIPTPSWRRSCSKNWSEGNECDSGFTIRVFLPVLRSHGLSCGKFFERESCKTQCSNGSFLKELATVLSRIPVKPHPFENRIEGDIWGFCTFLHFPFPPRNVRQ